MKSFQNRFFIVLAIIFSIFDTTVIVAVDFDVQEPTPTESSSKSWINRFKESEFNRRLSSKVNNARDFLTNKNNQSTSEPTNTLSTDTSNVYEKPVPPPHTVPERAPQSKLQKLVSFFSKKNNEPLLEYNAPNKMPAGSMSYDEGTLSDDDLFAPITHEIDWKKLNDTSDSKSLTSKPIQAPFKPQTYNPTEEDQRLDNLEAKVTKMTTPEEVATLTPQDIKDLSYAINQLPADLVSSLSREQIQNMDIDQILTFDKEQIQNFNVKDLTIQQIKRLVQVRSTGLLQNLTDAQLSSLSSEQIEACLEARPETFTEKQLDSLKTLLRLHGGSAVKIWLKDLSVKNFKNIFKSDHDILKNYLQDPDTREQRMQEPEVQKELKKLSRTEIAELFTKITHDEIQQIRQKSVKLSADQVEKLYIDTFNKNEKAFKKLLEQTDPLNQKEYILIPSRPKTIQTNSLMNFKFEILDMTSYDSNLTIAENAERMKKSQNLSTQVQDRFAQAKGETSNADLVTYIKNYLEDHPTFKNLKALMVSDVTALNRTTDIQNAQAELAKILNPKNDVSTKMQSLFRNLTSDQLTEITKAQIKAQERNMNLAGRGAKVSYDEAQRIFKQNAKVYQRFLNRNTLLIPVESAARNNAASFKFDKINLNNFQKDLNEIDFENVDLNIFDPASREFYAKKNINATEKLRTLIQKIKTEQPDISLSDIELAKEIKKYYQNKK